MQSKLLAIFTRTPLHVGSGSSVGAIDLPVVRERHTRFPVIPGSSIKGVLADLWMEEGKDVNRIPKKDKEGQITGYDFVRVKDCDAWTLFGDNSNKNGAATSGALAIGEAKLLAFPVRSAKGCFAYLTCPLALERFKRDCGKDFTIPGPDNDTAIVSRDSLLALGSKVVFEEYPLKADTSLDARLCTALQSLSEDAAWGNVGCRLAVVSDELFQYFAENDCEIAQHIRIDDTTGVVADGALFNQENVPSETLFYAPLHEIKAECMDKVRQKLEEVGNLLQIGADITTGLGWCSVKLV